MAEKIVVLPGDGIGPEVVGAALEILKECVSRHHLDLEVQEFEVGGQALEKHGEPLPAFVLEACRESRAVLLGAVGAPRFDDQPQTSETGTGPAPAAKRTGSLRQPATRPAL